MVFFKDCSADSAKKVQQTDGMFHARGGKNILFGSTMEKS